MEITSFLLSNISFIKTIVSEFEDNKEFSSHDFIEKFTERFESDYIEMLLKYQHSGQAFQTVHSQIALFLSVNRNDLKIHKTERKESENVRGNSHNIQWWKK